MRGNDRLACVAMLFVILAGFRGEAATERTCHWWHDLTLLGGNAYARSFKLGYVAGFAQGAFIFITQARSEEELVMDLVEPEAPHDLTKRLETLTATMEDSRRPLELIGFTTEQMVDGLDQFCADGANEEIDVHDGLKVVRWRLDGTPKVQIDRELKNLRTRAARGRGTEPFPR